MYSSAVAGEAPLTDELEAHERQSQACGRRDHLHPHREIEKTVEQPLCRDLLEGGDDQAGRHADDRAGEHDLSIAPRQVAHGLVSKQRTLHSHPSHQERSGVSSAAAANAVSDSTIAARPSGLMRRRMRLISPRRIRVTSRTRSWPVGVASTRTSRLFVPSRFREISRFRTSRSQRRVAVDGEHPNSSDSAAHRLWPAGAHHDESPVLRQGDVVGGARQRSCRHRDEHPRNRQHSVGGVGER